MLTSSIKRNLYISEVLTDVIGFSSDQIKTLLNLRSDLAMTNASTIESCWSCITNYFGITVVDARAIVLRSPWVLFLNNYNSK